MSLSLATGWPLQATIFSTICSAFGPVSLVRLVPMPKEVRQRPRKRSYSAITWPMSRPSLKTSVRVRGSIRIVSRCASMRSPHSKGSPESWRMPSNSLQK